MTVSTQITQRTYSGNGVNCQWTVDFPLADVQDLHVFITSPLGVQEEVFNFSLNADATCVEYPTAQSELDPLAEGWTISLVRKTPLTQQIDLTRHGELDAEVLEQGYDKLTLLAQEMKAQITQQATDLSTQQQALGTEVSNRQEACTTLQSNLSAETAARTQADQALQTALSGEIASRQQEDLAFERALNDEIAERSSAVEALQTQIDAKQEAGDYATNTALTSGLAGKQDTLTTSQLAAVDSGITSSTVSLIPTALQPNDNISSLTNDAHYVTTTDYATTDTGGVVKVSTSGGTQMNGSGVITTYRASDTDIDGKTNAYKVIVPRNLDYAVKMGITDNANTLTDAEKAAAQDWLGVDRTEPWLKPSDWVDIRSGALPNSVYFLVGHSADYATYPEFSVTPTVSNSGTYDVYVDGIKKATTASATATTLNWQTLALNTGYDVTYPSALRTHIVRITPSTSTNTFTAITMRENSVGQQGILWVHFTIKNSISLENFVYAQTGTSFPKLEAITCSEEALIVSNLRNAFAYNASLQELPLLDGTGLTNMGASFATTPMLKKIRLRNCNPTSTSATFVDAGVEKLETDNCLFPFSSTFNYAKSLKKLPPITASSSDTAAGINQDYGLEPTFLDLNGFDHITKLVCAGESSTKFLTGLKGLTVSANSTFSGTSPQIDVRYSALDRAALVNLFNSMPYNVGYEVVGNPTITDGVVSGFSGSDALLLNNNLDIKNGLEAVFKIHTASTLPNDNQYIMVYNPGNNSVNQPLGLWLGTSGKVAFSTRTGNIVSASALNNDTDYYLKVTSSSGVYELFYGTDGVNYTSIGTSTDTDAALTNHIELGAWTFGYASLYRPLKGSIDLNESYIKLNGNMWFSGTEAMTKTCNVVGCTGTADLTQTDKDIALDKGWSLTVA